MHKGVLSSSQVVERLSLLKYILEIALEQSRKPDPASATGLLLLHDALELLIDLVCAHVNYPRPKSLLDAWEGLSKAHGVNLPLRVSITKLNTSRNSLKHKGLRPHQSDINDFSGVAQSFYKEVCANVFSIDIDSLSLASLVTVPSVREHLRLAEEFEAQRQPIPSLQESAIAFELLIEHFSNGPAALYMNGPFHLSGALSVPSRGDSNYGMAATIKAVNEMRRPLQMVMLGLEYPKYVRFSLCVPKIVRLADGSIIARGFRQDVPSMESVRFAILYVIESSLQLQSAYFEADRNIGGGMMLKGHHPFTREEIDERRNFPDRSTGPSTS